MPPKKKSVSPKKQLALKKATKALKSTKVENMVSKAECGENSKGAALSPPQASKSGPTTSTAIPEMTPEPEPGRKRTLRSRGERKVVWQSSGGVLTKVSVDKSPAKAPQIVEVELNADLMEGLEDGKDTEAHDDKLKQTSRTGRRKRKKLEEEDYDVVDSHKMPREIENLADTAADVNEKLGKFENKTKRKYLEEGNNVVESEEKLAEEIDNAADLRNVVKPVAGEDGKNCFTEDYPATDLSEPTENESASIVEAPNMDEVSSKTESTVLNEVNSTADELGTVLDSTSSSDPSITVETVTVIKINKNLDKKSSDENVINIDESEPEVIKTDSGVVQGNVIKNCDPVNVVINISKAVPYNTDQEINTTEKQQQHVETSREEETDEAEDLEDFMLAEAQDQESAESSSVSAKAKTKSARSKKDNSEYIKCTFCGAHKRQDFMERHQKYSCKSNPDRKDLISCKNCMFATENPESLVEHQKVHPESFVPRIHRNNVCEVCGIEFETVKKKTYHEWKIHDYYGFRQSYHCEDCNKNFPSKWQYKAHVGYHTDMKNFVCDWCGKTFRSKQEVKDHKRLSHIEEQFAYQCTMCRIGLRTKEEQQTHECRMVAELLENGGFSGVNRVVYVQENEEPETEGAVEEGNSQDKVTPRVFFSLEAVTEFSQNGPIKVSERYMCEYCGQTFATKVQKFVHRKVEHGYRRLPKEARKVPEYECDICHKSFGLKDSLREHYNVTHSDQKNYSCSVCGKFFKRYRDAQYHQKTIHERSYKYRCDDCGRGVHRKSYLKNHKCDRVYNKRLKSLPDSIPPNFLPVLEDKNGKEKGVNYGKLQVIPPDNVGIDSCDLVEVELPNTELVENTNTQQTLGGCALTTSDIANLLPETGLTKDEEWIIQESEDGEQILVIQAGLAEEVEGQDILVETEQSEGKDVAQIYQAASILTKM